MTTSPSPRVVDAADLGTLIGTQFGPSEWTTIDQQMVTTFADLTGDQQWIHVDSARAAAGPFGGTIAHGYLTLALVPVFFGALLDVQGAAMGVNYGLDRVRFPSPVRVGDDVRATLTLSSVTPLDGAGVQASAKVTVEARSSDKPACVAQILFRFYRGD